MSTLLIADRVMQTALNLDPREHDRLLQALNVLKQDPFDPALSTHVIAIAGMPNTFVLRVSDRLRLIYSIQRQQPLSLPSPPESIEIVALDIVSKDGLRHYLSGGDE